MVELPILHSMLASGEELEKSTRERWNEIAARHPRLGVLDEGSKALFRRKHAHYESRCADDAQMKEVIARFERQVARETVFNEYRFRRQIHEWLFERDRPVDSLNKEVYARLFLTPDSDPWLGLVPTDVYCAMEPVE